MIACGDEEIEATLALSRRAGYEGGARRPRGQGLERTAAHITSAGGVALTVVGDLAEEAPAAQLIQTANAILLSRM